MSASDSEFDFNFFKVLKKEKFGWYVSVEPAVVIIPLLFKEGETLFGLILCNRPAIDKTSWEFPGGGMELNESPESAAKRELWEETGYISDETIPIGSFYESPGKLDFLHHIVVVINPTQKTLDFEFPSDEKIFEFRYFCLEELENMITENLIVSGPTLSSLQILKIYLQKHTGAYLRDHKKA